MIKPLLPLFFLLLLLAPLTGYCQLPSAKWVTTMGGSGDSKPTGMVTDSQNNVYVAGYFSGTVDFDPSAGVKNLTSVGGYDIYVAKYDANGAIIWAISMGGSDLDQVNAMGIDPNGNPTITGQFRSSDLIVGGAALPTSGDEDIFVIHLNTNGGLLWARTIGGPGTDRGEQVTADAQGNVIVTSIFQQTITIGGHTETAQNGFNGLIVKYDAAGNYIWNIKLGGVISDAQVHGNGIDSQGNIVVSGTFSISADFDPLGTHQVVNGTYNNPFVAKYTPAGKLIWVKAIDGTVVNNGSALSIDSNDDIYLSASFNNTLTFTPSASLSASGSQDSFLAKYQANGTFVFAKRITGNGSSFNYMIRNDKNKNVYLTGYFSGTIDFDPSAGVANVSGHGQRDLYLAKYDQNGNYQWAFSAGSVNCDLTLGIELAVINVDDIVLGGSFCYTVNFDPTNCNVTTRTAKNITSDSFIARYVQNSGTSGQITAFSIPQQIAPAVIDNTNLTVTVVVPANTNVTALVPTIAVSAGTLAPASGIAQNFTSPVSYTISGGCGASTVYKVTVLLAKTATTCAGATNTIAGDTPAPTGTYAWQVLQGNTWVNAPGAINTANYQTSALANTTAANIIYTLRRQTTASGGGLSYDSYYQVTVQPVNAITNNTATAPAISTFCATGDPAIITGSTPAGGNGVFTYQWQSSADNVTFANITGATAKDYDPPVVTATTYYHRTVSSGTCNTPTNSNVIKITIVPAIANNTITATGVAIFCTSGDASVITGSTPTGGDGTYLYQWQSSADNVTFNNIAGATAKDYDPAASSVTTYYRRSVTSGTCGSQSNTATITVVPAPANVVVTPVAAICAGSRATISVASPNASFTYLWYSSSAKTSVLFTGTSYTTDPLTINQTYYVEASNGTCISPALTSVTVNVTQAPATPAVAAAQVAVCSGSPATLAVASPQAALTYKWYSVNTGGTAVFTGAQYITGALSGNTVYYVDVTNATGCVSARTPVNITVNPLPQVSAQGATICPNGVAILTATSTDNNVSISWYPNATGAGALFTGASFPAAATNVTTTYYAEATNNLTGCISATRAPATIQIAQPLAAPIVTADNIGATSITFKWDAVSGATAYQVSTDNGQNFANASSGAAGLTHTINGLSTGQTVSIIVRATGALSCQSSNSVSVSATSVSLSNDIYVANAFTPNNDGKNDVVYVHSENISTIKFSVYSQWGEMLFASTNMQNGWDGTYNGKLEPAGVYVYYIQAVMKNGTALNKKGTITLIR